MSYTASLFTDCRTSTNDINFNIILSAFSIGDIVSYDGGSGTRCYYLESFTGTSSGVTNFDTPEFMSGQCESCITGNCDSMVAYEFVSCCTNDLENLITFGIYLPNFSAGTEVIVDPDSGDFYHMFSASSRGYSYCFETPNYDSCLDAYISNNRLPQCESVIVRRAFNCCSGESAQQIIIATNLQSGDTFSFSAQCWNVGNTATTTPIALISSGETTYSSCTDCSNQTKFMYNISNCNTSFGYKWVCMDQELITGQTYQMNVTIGSGGTFSATCFYVIARESDCESCLTYNNSGTVLSGPFANCGVCLTGATPTPTPTVTSTKTPTPTGTSSLTGVTPTVTSTKTPTPTGTSSLTGVTPTVTSTKTPTPTLTSYNISQNTFNLVSTATTATTGSTVFVNSSGQTITNLTGSSVIIRWNYFDINDLNKFSDYSSFVGASNLFLRLEQGSNYIVYRTSDSTVFSADNATNNFVIDGVNNPTGLTIVDSGTTSFTSGSSLTLSLSVLNPNPPITPTPTKTTTPTSTPTKTTTPTSTVSLTPGLSSSITPTLTKTPTQTVTQSVNCIQLVDVISATIPTNPITIIAGQTSIGFSNLGTLFYVVGGYNSCGSGSSVYHSTTDVVWKRTSSVNGPLNRTSIWANPNVKCDWLGFTKCLTISNSRKYYIGLAADNNYRFYIDGDLIIDTSECFPCEYNNSGVCTGGGYETVFNYWRVYEVYLQQGQHVIQMVAQNCGILANMGAEVYDNTLDELTGATSLNDINTIFSTEDSRNSVLSGGTPDFDVVISNVTGEYLNSGYTCPDGYTYACGNCYKYTNTCVTPTPTKSKTPTVTLTKTTTPTKTPTKTITSTGTPARTPFQTNTVTRTPTPTKCCDTWKLYGGSFLGLTYFSITDCNGSVIAKTVPNFTFEYYCGSAVSITKPGSGGSFIKLSGCTCIGPSPTPSVTKTATPTKSARPTPRPTNTVSPTNTPTNTKTTTITPTPSLTRTVTPTKSVKPTLFPTNTPTKTPTPTRCCSTWNLYGGTFCDFAYFSVTNCSGQTSTLILKKFMSDTVCALNVNVVSSGCSASAYVSNVCTCIAPTPTPTLTRTVTPTKSVKPTPLPTNTVTVTKTKTVTPTRTVTPTKTTTVTPTRTVSTTKTPTVTPTNTVTPTKTLTPSKSVTPSVTKTVTVTKSNTPTVTKTQTPSNN